jgi:NADH-quinone oxidoreductase subunit C
MRYDPERERVVYEPVTIEARVLVPRVKRQDHRYLMDEQEEAQDDA